MLRRHHAVGQKAVGHVEYARRRRQAPLHSALHGEAAGGQVVRGDVLAAHLGGNAKRVLAHAQALGRGNPRAHVEHEACHRSSLGIVAAARQRPQQSARGRLLVHFDLEIELAGSDVFVQAVAERAPPARLHNVEGIEPIRAVAAVSEQGEEFVVRVQRLDGVRRVSHPGKPCRDLGFGHHIKKQFAHKIQYTPPRSSAARIYGK